MDMHPHSQEVSSCAAAPLSAQAFNVLGGGREGCAVPQHMIYDFSNVAQNARFLRFISSNSFAGENPFHKFSCKLYVEYS